MLVLTRRPEETITIKTPTGQVITIKVCKVKGDAVRLGFDCDKSIEIHRDDAKKREATK
jgi:carbon storage regulator CsrA